MVATCPDCGTENRDNAKFCDGCGAKLGLAIAQQVVSSAGSEDADLEASFGEGASVESEVSDEADASESPGELEPEADGSEPGAEPESTEAEAEVQEEPPEEAPKTGFLVFPDNSEQPIPPSQWLIGRADLAKFLGDPKKANEISRGHLTVFQEGDRYFIEDGTTMVQRKPSANKTWIVRNGTRIMVTGTGKNELQDADEIDVAELVKLQFVLR